MGINDSIDNCMGLLKQNISLDVATAFIFPNHCEDKL